MNKKDIYSAAHEGISLGKLTSNDIAVKLGEIFAACELYGIDFSFYTKNILEATAQKLQRSYRFLTDRDLTIIVTSGCEGEFVRKPIQTMKGYVFFEWIREYVLQRNKIMAEHTDIKESEMSGVSLHKTPYGSAIIWKIENLDAERWEKVPMEELAAIWRRGITKEEIFEKFNI